MGLDMSIYGEKFIENSSSEVEIAYWRKHPNLHGYIVNTFANGVDECQRIYLSKDDIHNIISAVVENRLPHTDGFFFGSSDDKDANEDIKMLNDAAKYLEKNPDGRVYYQASW